MMSRLCVCLLLLLGISVTQSEPVPACPPLAQRQKMTRAERLQLLEALGSVPEDADPREWALAPETSWWGKELDPAVFWKDKVVWWDKLAENEARRHGRMYPPPPYKINGILKRETPKQKMNTGGPEGGGAMYIYNSEEDAFWSIFAKSHPRPPAVLLEQQARVAEKVLRLQDVTGGDGHSAGNQRNKSEAVLKVYRGRVVEQGYPAEAFDADALRWAYIERQRKEHERLLQLGDAVDAPGIRSFFRGLKVDPQYITNALDNEQIRVANAWKVAYLRFIREVCT